jgi:hypothetical protein
MLKHALAGMIAAVALSSPVVAKDAAPPSPAAPAELSQLDFFAGTWHCTGKAFANPMSPEHATTATVHADKAVGGRWLHVRYDENKTATNPTPYHIGVYMGYDSAKKQFVEGCVDMFGGYCTQNGSGWNGDTMTFEGTNNGMGDPAGVRDTFAKRGPNGLIHTGEMQGPDKKWNKTDEEACHRQR